MIDKLYQIFKEHPQVQTDTRKLASGDIFFALKGDNFNGNKFAQQALENGASYAVIDEAAYQGDDRTILVDDGLTALQQLAQKHREELDIPFLAITGSNGKTTTKELVYAVLSKKYKTQATKGNFNNHIGVPLTLLSIQPDTEFAIIEMGANHIGEIGSYCVWAQPNFALINNCGKAHLEGFGSLEGVRIGKGELYDYIRNNGGMIFRNSDLDYLMEMSEGIAEQKTYGLSGEIKGNFSSEGSFLKVNYHSTEVDLEIQTNLVGEYNFANVMAAIAIGKHFGVDLSDIKAALEGYAPTNNRSQQIERDGVSIILDAYNANPMSMKAGIEFVGARAHPSKVLMLGAMMELGPESIQEHQKVVDLCKQFTWKNIVLVGKEFGLTEHEYHHFPDSAAASVWYANNISSGDLVYIKGSRLTAMEKILPNEG